MKSRALRLAASVVCVLALLGPARAAPSPAPSAAPVAPAAPAAPTAARPEIPAMEHVSATVVVQVDDRDAAASALIAEAERIGGWFSSLSTEMVSFKVPVAEAEAFVEKARGLGLVVERSVSRTEIGPQVADATASLEARRAVLSRYFEVLGQARPESVVAVESEIDRIIREIETFEGRLRLLRHRGAYADVSVAFRFRSRRAPANDGRSPFGWVNTVDLGALFGDFRGGREGPRLRGASAGTPEGFAAFDVRGRVAAVSSDDVVYRVRSVKNHPEAELAFWEEALRTRLVAAGYRLVDRGEIVLADGTKGARLEWAAPDGERDAAWIVSLFMDGGSIVIAESAGEARAVAARREAILRAMQGIRL